MLFLRCTSCTSVKYADLLMCQGWYILFLMLSHVVASIWFRHEKRTNAGQLGVLDPKAAKFAVEEVHFALFLINSDQSLKQYRLATVQKVKDRQEAFFDAMPNL